MKKSTRLSRFELEILEILWRLGESSVREVQEAIPSDDRPAYTTVQTIVQRLEQKGAVRRTRKIGNALMFEAVVSRKSAYSLYSLDIASFTMGASYDQKDALGFINLIGLPIKVEALLKKQ